MAIGDRSSAAPSPRRRSAGDLVGAALGRSVQLVMMATVAAAMVLLMIGGCLLGVPELALYARPGLILQPSWHSWRSLA